MSINYYKPTFGTTTEWGYIWDRFATVTPSGIVFFFLCISECPKISHTSYKMNIKWKARITFNLSSLRWRAPNFTVHGFDEKCHLHLITWFLRLTQSRLCLFSSQPMENLQSCGDTWRIWCGTYAHANKPPDRPFTTWCWSISPISHSHPW